jgi:hypothetical protein
LRGQRLERGVGKELWRKDLAEEERSIDFSAAADWGQTYTKNSWRGRRVFWSAKFN